MRAQFCAQHGQQGKSQTSGQVAEATPTAVRIFCVLCIKQKKMRFTNPHAQHTYLK
jgi:hypothetical protein